MADPEKSQRSIKSNSPAIYSSSWVTLGLASVPPSVAASVCLSWGRRGAKHLCHCTFWCVLHAVDSALGVCALQPVTTGRAGQKSLTSLVHRKYS